MENRIAELESRIEKLENILKSIEISSDGQNISFNQTPLMQLKYPVTEPTQILSTVLSG